MAASPQSQEPEMKMTAASAPGKVLLAGGYLVLDRAYNGLTFGLNARIHALVQDVAVHEGHQEIGVRSPQFEGAVWRYRFAALDEEKGVEVEPLDDPLVQKPNPFVETTLTYALTYIAALSSPSTVHAIRLTILADNDYYSTASTSTDAAPSRFQHHHTSLTAAHKTGLGSSAALVTSLTAALLTHYLSPHAAFNLASEAGKSILHNLSQAAHSAAQGKIGSGFDVASAVYGSCLYRRFSPAVLTALDEARTKGFATRLVEVVGGPKDQEAAKKWDHEITPLGDALATAGLRLALLDVDAGTSTPGMVSRVLAWRAKNPADANGMWDAIHAQNEALAASLRASETGAADRHERLRGAIGRIRDGMREMSAKADVPVEPPAQTELIDSATVQVKGVHEGVVPGAGGFDAVALVLDDEREASEQLQAWVEKRRGGGGAKQADGAMKVRLLGVREDPEGIKEEMVGELMYKGWI